MGKKAIRIGDYEVIEKIAEGAFGPTYRVRHVLSGKEDCLKHAKNISAASNKLLLQEVEVLWDLSHHFLPGVRGFIEHEDIGYALIMRYIPGPTLKQYVESKGGSVDPYTVCWITQRLLNALLYLAERNVAHGDLKPGNIILQEDPRHDAFLVDFGLSQSKPKDATSKGYMPEFSAPEQVRSGIATPQGDMYALGKTMLYALGGMTAVRSGNPPANTPADLTTFIHEFIKIDPDKRPHPVSDIAEQFRTMRAKNDMLVHRG